MQVLATQLVSRKVDVVLQLELAGSTQVCPKVQLWHCPTRALVTRWCIWQCLEAGCQLGPLRLTLFLPPDDTEYFFDNISNSWGTVLSEFLFSKFKWNKTPHKTCAELDSNVIVTLSSNLLGRVKKNESSFSHQPDPPWGNPGEAEGWSFSSITGSWKCGSGCSCSWRSSQETLQWFVLVASSQAVNTQRFQYFFGGGAKLFFW